MTVTSDADALRATVDIAAQAPEVLSCPDKSSLDKRESTQWMPYGPQVRATRMHVGTWDEVGTHSLRMFCDSLAPSLSPHFFVSLAGQEQDCPTRNVTLPLFACGCGKNLSEADSRYL